MRKNAYNYRNFISYFFGMIAYRKLAVKNSTTINAGEVAQNTNLY